MSKIVMPGTRDRNARARVWLPNGATKAMHADVISICRVPVAFDAETGEVKTCGQKFVKGQEARVERHHAQCARDHDDVIRAYLQQRHPDIMKPWDPEYAAWLKQHARGIAEGRVRW